MNWFEYSWTNWKFNPVVQAKDIWWNNGVNLVCRIIYKITLCPTKWKHFRFLCDTIITISPQLVRILEEFRLNKFKFFSCNAEKQEQALEQNIYEIKWVETCYELHELLKWYTICVMTMTPLNFKSDKTLQTRIIIALKKYHYQHSIYSK